MAVHPLRPATRRRLGRPLPHQQADRPRAHLAPKKLSNHHTKGSSYPVLDPVSQAYPRVQGRSPTCYSPVRHSSTPASRSLSVRLACVKHAASVRPEPGSNSPQKNFRTTSETGREKPETQQKNKPPQTTQQCSLCWRPKNYYKEKIQFPQPDGVKKEETTKVEHNHMPTNPSQCSRNTKQHSNKYVFHIPNRHTPTNKPLSLLADKPINTQPCTQKIKSTLAHY